MVEIVSEATLYAHPRGTSRVERLKYSDGTVEYGVWVASGAHAEELLSAAQRVPLRDDKGAPLEMAHMAYDGDTVGLIYRHVA
ncbi:hypothetical protein GCM10010149_47780 [Nonomuraea roseoviolacea subsp. roseoviolacea]|uniref:hypothetical protein n=1 Tax=Nonomuraea roseoviolacea TaxID=103837 RepID=UPI0031D936D8